MTTYAPLYRAKAQPNNARENDYVVYWESVMKGTRAAGAFDGGTILSVLKEDGEMRLVLADDGQKGWVYRDNLERISEPRSPLVKTIWDRL